MSTKSHRHALAAVACCAIAWPGICEAQTIAVAELGSAPVIDGEFADWRDVPGNVVPLRPTRTDSVVRADSVLVKGGVHGKRVYFYFEWADEHADLVHKPWVWDSRQNKYVTGPQREDRLAVQLAMSGDYTTDWLSGKSFRADMWHWKASRTNPLGLAHDKMTIISAEKILRAPRFETPDGGAVYIARPSDAGDKLYRTMRYGRRVEATMPKYIPMANPTGSIADVSARGVWADGKWRLELSRALDTGHDDDVVLARGREVRGGIAVFDHSENDDHAISATLTFRF